MKWKELNSKTVYKNDFFSIKRSKCQKSDGNIVEEYYSIDRADAAIIAAFTPEKELILIKQYRHPVQAIDLELPAGYINPDETDIAIAAERELMEETGYQTDPLIKLAENYSSAGIMTNKVHFFIGLNAKKVQEQNLDPHENIEVSIIPWKYIQKLLQNGAIKDLGSSNGILLAKDYLESA